MEYGCIGEVLKHSFSKEIHALITDYDYVLKELGRDEVDGFMRDKNFRAINVTIPYKETVIPYLDFIDEPARLIGAVNTVVNREGMLCGYNTDFYGMSKLAEHAGISFKDKKVLILGTGGTSKTALAVAKYFGASEIIRASRDGKEGAVLYTDVYKYHTNSDIIINTTPVGMYPRISASPIDLSKFEKLIGVLDAVYNPLSTELILAAKERGISAEGGLYMLVAQGVRASEIFLDTTYPDNLLDVVFSKIIESKENLVLIGMPSSGKSTVGAILAERLGRTFIDTDELIVKKAKKDIPSIFHDDGEVAFRAIEAEVISEICASSGLVIATGGGAILNTDNVKNLKKNGRLYFIDRPLECLTPTIDRPLSSTRTQTEARYKERYPIYSAVCDVKIDANCTPQEVADKILMQKTANKQ